jgi:hypothetical protein
MFHLIYFLINTLAWGIIFTMLAGFSIGLLSVAAHCLANGPKQQRQTSRAKKKPKRPGRPLSLTDMLKQEFEQQEFEQRL